jgi:hypothetical protein
VRVVQIGLRDLNAEGIHFSLLALFSQGNSLVV